MNSGLDALRTLSLRSLDLSTRSIITAAAAAALAGVAVVGPGSVAVLLAALVLLLAWGWPRLLGLPVRSGSSVVVALAGVGAVLTVYATPHPPLLRNLPLVLAMGVVLAFINELLRSDERERLVESLSGTVSGVLVVVSVAGWLAVAKSPSGEPFVIVAAVGLAAGAVMAALPLYGWPSFSLTVLAATVGGTVAARLLPGPGLTAGVITGVVTGMLVASMHLLFARLPALRGLAGSVAAIVAPLCVVGILVYAVARVTMAS